MATFTQIVSLLTIALAFVSCDQDTDGTSFITSFVYKNAADPANFELSLFILPTNNVTTTVTMQWYSLTQQKLVTSSFNATFRNNNKHIFAYNDVISEGHYGDGQPKNLTDSRIYITSTAPVKVIARLINLVTNQGDVYLVPSTTFANQKYLFKLPKPVLGREQIVHLLAMPNQDANVWIVVTGPQGHNMVNQTVKLNGALGGNQIILPFTTIDIGPSIYVSSDTPIVVVGAVTCADLNAFNVNDVSSNNTCDYAAYMPQAIGTWDCVSNLSTVDQRVTLGDHTANIIVSPADSTCGKAIPINVYSNVNPVNALNQQLTSKIVSRYQIVHSYISELAVSSPNAFVSMTRVGTPRATKNATLNGIYMHYVPETTQFYNGLTQFVAFTGGDFLEVYIENLKASDNLALDGVPMLQAIINPRVISSYNNVYTVVEFYIPFAGVHTFSSTANYVAYVVSKADNQTNTGFGYITGFGATKITNIGTGTTVNPGTTTQSIQTTTKVASGLTVPIVSILLSVFYFILSYTQ
uniref:IgGFc_binding domain-containing protein n=1 Tax=Parastrongyloides trichosuri TaxID=131310 RepID=A0A0N4ZQ17_PARTI